MGRSHNISVEAVPTSSTLDGFKANLVFKEIEKRLEEEGEQFVKKIGGIFAFKVKDGPEGREATWVVDVKNGKGAVLPNSGQKRFGLDTPPPQSPGVGVGGVVRRPLGAESGVRGPRSGSASGEVGLGPVQRGEGQALRTCPRECLPVLASGVGAGAVRACVLPCSVSFIQGSDRCLSFEGLPEEAFEHLTNLNYLYLANNKLTLAPRFLPNALISVDFAANYLTKIYGLTFGQKPNLRSVYLHNNKLADAGLPDNMFNGSSNVEILILSSNFLRHVPKHLPPALYKLHLKNNKLEKIPPGVFSELSNLRELYLQNNYLTDEGLDNETFWKLSSLEYLDLSSNNLSRVPAGLPRSLVLLHLEKNAIRCVDADVLTPIRSLEYLLLHSNQLRAQGIHPRAFQGLKRLHTVHLYNNALERVPSGLPRRVRTLMILHNQITGIGRDDFATTYFLEELNLSYNRITSAQVHRDAFRKLRQLRSLDLSGNRLHTLPPGLPRNVHVLKIKRNELAALARGALAGMAQLRELYLTGNRLRSRALGPRAWADLAGLQLLDIAGNQLTEIPEGLPRSLEYLYLQNNKISAVLANAFDSTPNLKGIFLRFNKLAVGSVVDSAFRRLKHLQVLDIEGNFEFGDVSKDRGRVKEAEEDEDEDEEDEERR
uniref:SCP2 domain-containing protein n=1 Tax=Sus scrofa TaxID=9823 RepID=A0A8D0XYT2_PIG